MRHLVKKRIADELLDSLPAHIAILNSQGEIIDVNESWKQFARENDCSDSKFYVGVNYLAVCEQALQSEHDDTVEKTLRGIHAVFRGEENEFLLEYPCNSPTEARWFTVRAKHFEYKGETYVIVLHENITGAKLAEKVNEEGNARFRQLYENSMDAILLTAPDGSILTANPAACQMFDRTEDEILMLGRSGLLDVSDPRLMEALRERERTGRFRGELTGICRDGTKFPIEVTSNLFTDYDGGKLTVTIIRDMTKQEQAETKLKENRNLFRHLTDNLPDAIYTLDLEQRQVTYFNRNTFLGYDRDELMAQGSLLKYIHPEDVAAVSDYWQRLLGGKRNEGMEYRIQNKNGQWEWVESREIIINSNPDGTPKEIMVILRVVTDRKQAEATLRANEEKWRRLFEILPVGVSIIDENRVIVDMNSRLEKILSISKEGLLAASYRNRQYLHGDNTPFALEEFPTIRAIQEQRSIFDIEMRVITEDGNTIWTTVSAAPLPFQHEKAVVVTADITERKRAEEKLTQMYQIIEEKNRELEQALDREHHLARTDGLTGAKNYRHFFEIATYEIAMANRYLHPLSIILFDIDKFKKFNDTFGHQLGDEMLKHVVQIAKKRLRETDVLSRYGGEEFVVVLPNTTSKDAFAVAEDIRKHIASSFLGHKEERKNVTISIGIAETLPNEKNGLEKLVRLADKALYVAKKAGRNQSVIYSSEMDK
ncbi:MAG: PAS domain S-box protein [Anaerolineales bacterium]|nr:PAS domain S-box protein [Anaerolineales bacterium]